MGDHKAKYDIISDFHQGVAIVVKNDLYGAILVGGHEIIPPSFDYIATFEDGLAQAIKNGRCEMIDLSGRVCKKYNGQWISIPAQYDCVRDFNDGYACVMLDGKWGAIDTEGNEIFVPQFDYLSDFIKGTAIYQKESNDDADFWGYLNVDGYCSECNQSKPPIINDDGSLVLSGDEGKILINNKVKKPPICSLYKIARYRAVFVIERLYLRKVNSSSFKINSTCSYLYGNPCIFFARLQ